MRTNPSGNDVSPTVTGDKQDFLVFRLGDEEYGIRLETVQELCGFDKVIRLDGAPQFIAGVVDLHGRRIAVVDLHVLLLSHDANTDRLADVIILSDANQVSAIAVDCVIDVITVNSAYIESATVSDAIAVIGKTGIGQRSVILLDAKKLMTSFRPGTTALLAA